jgi:Holliday junction resolvasome RuvABC endonuclease subunit
MFKNQTNRQPIILGIDPGTRHMGVAVLCGGKLLYYGVKTFKKDKRGCPLFSDLERAIINLAGEYAIDCIALEKIVSFQQRSSPFGVVSNQIRAIAEKRHYNLREYSPAFVRSCIGGNEKITRAETYRIITGKYPELRRYLLVSKIWQKTYFARLFDAVAAALLREREYEEDRQLSAATF